MLVYNYYNLSLKRKDGYTSIRRSSITFIVFFVAFPDSSAAADGPSIALSINVVSAHQPAAWHHPRRNIFGQYLCKTLSSPRRLFFLRDVGNMVIKIDPCFPSNLSKQLTCKRTTLIRVRASFVSIAVIFDSLEICIKLIRKYLATRRTSIFVRGNDIRYARAMGKVKSESSVSRRVYNKLALCTVRLDR